MTDTPETTPDTGARAEATGTDQVTVTWNDQEWQIPPSIDHCDVTALQAWENGKALTFIEIAVGKDQWRRFLKGNRRTGGDAAEFMKVIFRDAWGVDLGE